MNPILFFTDYFRWHYSYALFDMLRVWGNFLWIILHTFSTVQLLQTLISPWKRMHEEKPPKGTFDPGYYAGSILVNVLMRIVGMLVRSVIIIISMLIFTVIFLAGVLLISFWLVAPFGLVLIFINGLVLIGY